MQTEEELRDLIEKFREEYKSVIAETPYEKVRWCEKNLAEYCETVKLRNTLPTQRKIFYLAASGSICRNNILIQCVVWLKKYHYLDQQYLDQLLEDTPLLQLSAMVERSPGSCEFSEVTFDLVKTAIDYQVKDVLWKILPYIDSSLYDQKMILSILEQT